MCPDAWAGVAKGETELVSRGDSKGGSGVGVTSGSSLQAITRSKSKSSNTADFMVRLICLIIFSRFVVVFAFGIDATQTGPSSPVSAKVRFVRFSS